MSTGEFSGVDLDLLADYLGGALEGTPEEVDVARLVAEDPAWARAHAALAPAVTDTRADLATFGEPALEMPAEVADRILAALATAEPPESASSETLTSASTDVKPAPVPAQPLGGPRRPGRTLRPSHEWKMPTHPGRRRRWARVAGPVALAAAAVVGLGALQLSGQHQSSSGQADTALSDHGTGPVRAEENEPQIAREGTSASGGLPASGGNHTPYRIAAPPERTGTDYTADELTKANALPKITQFSSSEAQAATPDERTADGGDLARLDDQTALSACLAEIGTEHGGGPVTFDVVDYARFQGLPALVVRFTDSSGARWAWVSGPECGVPGSGSDTRYRTRVG
ncbi:hypothetical protein [Micromonospora endophytica]|uniref:Uncharacterized protein n=1 Tax=Micromonospora endophytica TaxID=515350 RepID=A0A2W2D944_9ACTN|nr:hypothetical protein [Micromonospora endophytica]PZG00409.1 hypothetical protein C1I93_02620 [Micromonospora endophytica]RIW47745.1 hypothetical protein D3H59_09605 [Micromonospora endophytica]BCJ59435.1 hypothetical protein Jiend_28570 [Micromonospora endophytica]